MKTIRNWALVMFCLGFGSVSWGQNNQDEITGAGTLNFIPRFTSPATIGNSQLFQGSGIAPFSGGAETVFGVGTANPQATLQLNFGDTANRDAFVIGHCTYPIKKCLMIRDTGSAIDVQSKGVDLLLYSEGGNVLITPYPNSGNVAIGTITPTNILTVQQNSTTEPIADAWTTYSSARWKTNIQPIANALDKVEHLRGVTFNWKANGKHDLGVVAEEVAPVVPEIVGFEQSGKAQSVDYGRLTALLLEAIKEQQAEIRELELQIENMAGKLSDTPPTRAGTGQVGQ